LQKRQPQRLTPSSRRHFRHAIMADPPFAGRSENLTGCRTVGTISSGTMAAQPGTGKASARTNTLMSQPETGKICCVRHPRYGRLSPGSAFVNMAEGYWFDDHLEIGWLWSLFASVDAPPILRQSFREHYGR
jgi:hypothetical protein